MSGGRAGSRATATRRPGPGLRLWGLAFLVIVVALAAVAAWPVYESPRFVVVAVAGTVLAAALALLSARLRWRAVATTAAALLVYVLAVVPLAVPAALASPPRMLTGLRDGVFGIVLGWKQLVTLELPLGEYQAVLVPWFVVVFAGGLAVALLVVRGDRSAPAAVPVAVLMVGFGLAFGASTTSAPIVLGGVVVPSPRELAVGAALVLACLVWLVGRARIRRAAAIRVAVGTAGTVRRTGTSTWMTVRRNAVAVGLVLVAVAGSAAIAPAAAGLTGRSALRDSVAPSVVLREQPSPLSAYRAAFAGDAYGAELFTVSGDLDAIGRVRIATLDAYDGETFHVGAESSEPGAFRRLPRAGGGAASFELTAGERTPGVWMPVPDGLDSAPAFTGPRADELADGFYVGADGATAIETAASDAGVRGLAAGDGYRVGLDPVAAGGLGGATGGESKLDAESYPSLVAWAESQAQPRTGEGLVELVARLRERGYLSHSLADDESAAAWITALRGDGQYGFKSSAAGHSTARIERLFQELVDQQQRAGEGAETAFLVAAPGDDEQYAVAAALLARYQGFDSRVVLGVRVGEPADPALAACDGVCTGGDLAAWTEVRVGAEWVALDATPQHAMAPIDISVGEVLPEHATVADELAPELIDPEQVPSDDRQVSQKAPVDPERPIESVWPVLRIAGLSAGAALSAIAPFAVLLLAKSARRRGRRTGPPELAIVGAWEELMDRYADFGVPFEHAATRASAARASGRPAAVSLATAVDHAVFSEHPPPLELADWAWQTVDAELDALRSSVGLQARIGATLGLAGFRRSLHPDTPPAPRTPRPRKEPA